MTRKIAHRQMQLPSLGVAIVYSVIVLLHLFFIPNFLAGAKRGNGENFRGNTKGIYTLLRNDRTTLTENKSTRTTPKSLQLFVVSLAVGLCVLYKRSAKNVQPVQVLAGKRYSYLTCRVIRI